MSNPFNAGFAEGQAQLDQMTWPRFGTFAGTAMRIKAFGDFARGQRRNRYAPLEAMHRGFAR